MAKPGAPAEFQVDAVSWRSLQQPYLQTDLAPLRKANYERGQHSAENILHSGSRQKQNQIYAEINPHDITYRKTSRAAPQVPLYKKMGRRASEGSALSENEHFDYTSVNITDPEDVNMKALYKSNYLPESVDMHGHNYPNPTGCRLSLDVGRRESSSSLSSSLADGSKDSLASYDSVSTLTGHETDDSPIMTRFRKSVKQKEEFLNMPTSTVGQDSIRREYYSRPKKLETQMWPPNDRDFPSKTNKPIHQNFQRVKNDIDNERDLVTQNSFVQGIGGGTAVNSLPQQRMAASPKDNVQYHQGKMHEAEIAPGNYRINEMINGTILEEKVYDERR